MNKKILILLPLLCSMMMGCNNKNSDSETIGVTDMSNRTVFIKPGSYSRVICIGAGALRLYSYVGDVDLLAGVEDIDNLSLSNRPKMFDNAARPYVLAYGETFKTLPSCGVGGPNNQSAEAEKILSCNPDIVISEYEDVDKANALQEQLGVPVITLSYGSAGVFDTRMQNSLTLLGKVFKKENKAKELNQYIQDEANEISNRTKNVASEEKAYVCGLGQWGTTNQYYTAQNYTPFNLAHINNVVNDLTNDGIQKIEAEKFVSYADDIDVMFIDSAAIKNMKPMSEEVKANLALTNAWKNHKVYLQMAYNAYYTNCEIALANTWYNAKIMYPSLFNDIDMKDKTNEITKKFLNQELAEQIFAAGNSFGGYQNIDVETFFNSL